MFSQIQNNNTLFVCSAKNNNIIEGFEMNQQTANTIDVKNITASMPMKKIDAGQTPTQQSVSQTVQQIAQQITANPQDNNQNSPVFGGSVFMNGRKIEITCKMTGGY
jgi:hypothetical protein